MRLRVWLPVVWILLLMPVLASAADPPLRPWDDNAWYWSYRDKPVLMLGGTDDDNLFQWPEKMLIPQLDRLAAAGGNVIRNTMSDRNDKGFEVYPFQRLDNGKYDLNKWSKKIEFQSFEDANCHQHLKKPHKMNQPAPMQHF